MSVSVSPDRRRDLALIARIRNGDAGALQMLMEYYLTPVYRFAYVHTRDAVLAEDVAQEVFVQLWERRHTLVMTGSVQSYLFQSVRNRALNVLRHERSLQRVGQVFTQEGTVSGRDPEDTVELRELTDVLRATVARMPARMQEIFFLHREQSLPAAEIAAMLGVGVATVHNQLSLARKALQQAVEAWRT